MRTRDIRMAFAVLLVLAFLFACYATGGVITIDLAGAAATPFVVPEGYSVRVYNYDGLTTVFVVQPPNEDPERALYAYWGVVHQAQARRLDAQVLDCYAVGDLTIQCQDWVVTFGTERGQGTTELKIPRRD